MEYREFLEEAIEFFPQSGENIGDHGINRCKMTVRSPFFALFYDRIHNTTTRAKGQSFKQSYPQLKEAQKRLFYHLKTRTQWKIFLLI